MTPPEILNAMLRRIDLSLDIDHNRSTMMFYIDYGGSQQDVPWEADTFGLHSFMTAMYQITGRTELSRIESVPVRVIRYDKMVWYIGHFLFDDILFLDVRNPGSVRRSLDGAMRQHENRYEGDDK